VEVKGYLLPDDLYYEPNHSWGRVEGDVVTVGINDFAQKLAGEFVSVDLQAGGSGRRPDASEHRPVWRGLGLQGENG